jgi:hypothetical protein
VGQLATQCGAMCVPLQQLRGGGQPRHLPGGCSVGGGGLRRRVRSPAAALWLRDAGAGGLQVRCPRFSLSDSSYALAAPSLTLPAELSLSPTLPTLSQLRRAGGARGGGRNGRCGGVCVGVVSLPHGALTLPGAAPASPHHSRVCRNSCMRPPFLPSHAHHARRRAGMRSAAQAAADGRQ